MTKTIKFNLILDKKPVRDLEGLQENFNLDEILDYYNSGVLQRWLEVRGYDEHFKKILDVRGESELDIAESLVRAFGVAKNLEEIKRASFKFQSKREREQFLDKIEASKIKRNEVIASYHGGYNKLINEMIEKSDDITFAKQALNDIHENYNQLWLVDFERAFIDFCSKTPFVIFAILMNRSYRELIMSDDLKIKKIESLRPIPEINEEIDHVTGRQTITVNNLQTPFKFYAGDTETYWRDIEPNSSSNLILNIGDGDYVQSYVEKGNEFGRIDVINKYPIINGGINYKSKNANNVLTYLEV